MGSAIGDRRFVARAEVALVFAHGRYWSSVAPLVRLQLRLWEARAARIPNDNLRRIAQGKLRDERFNVEVAAMISTIAPRRHRVRTVQAIVALQIMYDYLDGLTEQPTADPVRDGLRSSRAFLDAVTLDVEPSGLYYAHALADGDGGYLACLALAVRDALAGLPAVDAIAEVIPMTTARCAEAQVRVHVVPRFGAEQLQSWAEHQARDTDLQWREWLFGAMGSVVAAHALIALAANKHATSAQARELDSTYLSLCVLTTVLDHLVDYEQDVLTGEQSCLHLYESQADLSRQIAIVTRRVIDRARTIPSGPHHLMILSGVVAYYTSQPSAMGEFARPVTDDVRGQLRPLITPTLATLHLWRLAKRIASRA